MKTGPRTVHQRQAGPWTVHRRRRGPERCTEGERGPARCTGTGPEGEAPHRSPSGAPDHPGRGGGRFSEPRPTSSAVRGEKSWPRPAPKRTLAAGAIVAISSTILAISGSLSNSSWSNESEEQAQVHEVYRY
jgi:hypothetical protein